VSTFDFTQLDLNMLQQHVASALQNSGQQQPQQPTMQQQQPMLQQQVMMQAPWHQDQQQQQQAPLQSRLEDLLNHLGNKSSTG
jgi:hypothetical protein